MATALRLVQQGGVRAVIAESVLTKVLGLSPVVNKNLTSLGYRVPISCTSGCLQTLASMFERYARKAPAYFTYAFLQKLTQTPSKGIIGAYEIAPRRECRGEAGWPGRQVDHRGQ
jgi:hypothetical protein